MDFWPVWTGFNFCCLLISEADLQRGVRWYKTLVNGPVVMVKKNYVF